MGDGSRWPMVMVKAEQIISTSSFDAHTILGNLMLTDSQADRLGPSPNQCLARSIWAG